jgi:hypothetical protein
MTFDPYPTKVVMRVMPFAQDFIPLPTSYWYEEEISPSLSHTDMGMILAEALAHIRNQKMDDGFDPIRTNIFYRVTFREVPSTYDTGSPHNRIHNWGEP